MLSIHNHHATPKVFLLNNYNNSTHFVHVAAYFVPCCLCDKEVFNDPTLLRGFSGTHAYSSLKDKIFTNNDSLFDRPVIQSRHMNKINGPNKFPSLHTYTS